MMRRSIRVRLTTWYAGSIALLLLAGTAVARTLVQRSLAEEFARAQVAATQLVRSFFRTEMLEYRQIDATLAHISGELVIADHVIEFLQPNGDVYAPPPSVRVMPQPELPPPLQTIIAPLDAELAPAWRLRLVTSSASLERQLASVDRVALLAVPVLLVGAVLVGWVLTGRTLRPVAVMAAAADRITADGHGRLPVPSEADELARLGGRFNALLDRLDAAMTQQRRFLADAAHELRTPIARARGATELATSTGEPADHRDALVRTQEELDRMSRLVDELLELARSDAAERGDTMRPGFLDDVAADVVRSFEPLAAQRRVHLAFDAPEAVPLTMDAVAMTRLLGVLVDNAIRYSPAEGTVRVHVTADAGWAVAEVLDEGIGIRPDEQPRLAERFFRGAAARERSPGGAGLGLAIAQAIALRHRAVLGLQPREPRGAVATLRVPSAAASRLS